MLVYISGYSESVWDYKAEMVIGFTATQTYVVDSYRT